MSVANLDLIFHPTSVAVVGASRRPHTVGNVVVRNLLEAGFEGPVIPVNPHYQSVRGVLAYPTVNAMPMVPDLAIVATPPPTVPGLVDELGRRGVRAVVVITAGVSGEHDEQGRPLDQVLLEVARRHGLRLLGPNCVGLLVPPLGLNASFGQGGQLETGHLAFVSQSGALCTAVLEWARDRGIGFSSFVSLGDMLDVDVGDVLDHLAGDPQTRAILLYIEQVKHARRFLSAARAAARNKPVIAIKSGRGEAGKRAARSHTGALAGSDAVYDYALTRAGVLRVNSVNELFDAVETLAHGVPTRGDRLAILTNGGGPGVMAADALASGGGRLAELTPETLAALDAALPSTWSHGDPVDIIGDAAPDRYEEAARIVLADPGVDALLVVNAPSALADPLEVARAIVRATRGISRPVFASWLGGRTATAAHAILGEEGIPTYASPEDAVKAFVHMIRYQRTRELLMETPPSAPETFEPRPGQARAIVDRALADERPWLTGREAQEVLAAYGVATVDTRTAPDVDGAVAAAEELGYPVALKILSPDILHKSDVGGVVLDLADGSAVREAAEAMSARLSALEPDARLRGFVLQRMARRPRAHELIVGASVDPIFGPFLLFGQGGTAVEVIEDRAVSLPPLNLALARELMTRTRVWRLLQGYRDRPAADLDAVAQVLTQVSQMLVEIPEIVELDVNPLLADEKGVLALDVRMKVEHATTRGPERLAIRPYPQELEEHAELPDGHPVLLRPVRPEDEPGHAELFGSLEPDDVRFRFFHLVKRMPHSELARYTQIDYDREMAFVAVDEADDGAGRTLGEVRAVADPDDRSAEFAIVVRTDIKGRGLGKLLLEKLIGYLASRGTGQVVGRVLADNQAMLRLAAELGFRSRSVPDSGEVEVCLPLGDRRPPRPGTRSPAGAGAGPG